LRKSFVFAILVALLSGCMLAVPHRAATEWPVGANKPINSDGFPAQVAEYRRGKITAFTPEATSFAVPYDRYDAQLQNAVTLFFGPKADDVAGQIRAEIAAVIKDRPDHRVISEQTLTIEKTGRVFDAKLIEFEYTSLFAGRNQKVLSFLLIAFTDNKRFKVRSTAPVEQGDLAIKELRRLLDSVSWER
jgi:hypothetical protein